MYLRTLLILIVLGAVAIFAAINWKAFMAPTTLSVVFATLEAPLGLILLAVVGLLTLLFLAIRGLFAVLRADGKPPQCARTTSAAGTRRAGGSFSVSANCARFWKASSVSSGKKPRRSKIAVLAKLEGVERELRAVVEQSGNTLAACIGEIEDRLERAPGGAAFKGLCVNEFQTIRVRRIINTLRNRFRYLSIYLGRFSGRLLQT